jgi:hypothetical protein
MASVSAATKVKLAPSTGGVTKIRGDRFDRIRHAVSRGVGSTVAERGKSTPGRVGAERLPTAEGGNEEISLSKLAKGVRFESIMSLQE